MEDEEDSVGQKRSNLAQATSAKSSRDLLPLEFKPDALRTLRFLRSEVYEPG